jgi:hypothetical protein
VKIFGIVGFLGLSIFFIFKYFLDKMFESGGLILDKQPSLMALVALIFTYVLFSVSSYSTAKKGIYKQL